MSSPIDPVRRAARIRRGHSAPDAADRPAEAFEARGADRSAGEPPRPETSAGAEAVFAAQLLGQDAAPRPTGPEGRALGDAANVYNKVEWSGAADRRSPKGRFTRKNV